MWGVDGSRYPKTSQVLKTCEVCLCPQLIILPGDHRLQETLDVFKSCMGSYLFGEDK